MRDDDRSRAREWAQSVIARNSVIVDTETTGLYDAQMVQFAAIDCKGKELLDTLVMPSCEITVGAQAVHGIGMDRLEAEGALPFSELAEQISDVLHGKHVVVYNLAYDWPIITAHYDRAGIERVVPASLDCVMLMYAQWFGEWNDYYGNYRWQNLGTHFGGDHTAIGDCRATLACLRKMANEEAQ